MDTRTKRPLMIMTMTTLVAALVATGCSSSPPKHNIEQDEKVLSRIDDLSSRPGWVKESEPFIIKDGIVTSLGQTTIPADNRVEAAYRIAENSAKAAISNNIEQRLSFVFQNAEEGTGMDATQARYIGAEASELTTSEIKIGKRYWEKVSTVTGSGEPRVVYKVFASVTMSEADLKRAILDAARKRQGKGGLSADFSAQVSKHWDKFVNGATSDRSTASKGE